MRTTLDLDDDVLKVARDLAAHRGQSIGKVISEYFRKSLIDARSGESVINGVRVISRGSSARPVTLELVNKLRDEGI